RRQPQRPKKKAIHVLKRPSGAARFPGYRPVGKIVSSSSLPLILASSIAFAAPAAAQETETAYEDRVAAALAPVPGGLTADQAAERAVARSPEIAARTAEIDASLAQRNRTLARYVPRLEV